MQHEMQYLGIEELERGDGGQDLGGAHQRELPSLCSVVCVVYV